MTHIHPIGSTGSPKSQSVKLVSTLGIYCTNEVLTTSLEGVGRAVWLLY